MKYVIFDLDGCLADDRHRQPQLRRSFDAYHSDCDKDPLINAHLINMMEHYKPIIFTGRPEKFRDKTLWWLKEVAKINPQVVCMRPDDCFVSSPELKKGFLENLVRDGFGLHDILVAFDDREDVLAVYSAYGIPTSKVSYPSKEDEADVKSPAENLSRGAKTFKERNAVYGGSFLTFGGVMSALFPDGMKISALDNDAFNRLGVFVQIIGKCCRYAAKFGSGGHTDSAHDLMVYAAILESLTKENVDE